MKYICVLGITMVEEAEAFLLYLFYMAAGRVTRPRQIWNVAEQRERERRGEETSDVV